jgi:hypothetical protein
MLPASVLIVTYVTTLEDKRDAVAIELARMRQLIERGLDAQLTLIEQSIANLTKYV